MYSPPAFISFLVVVLVTQSCPALCDPMDCSPPGSSAIEFSRQEYWSGQPFLSPGDLSNPRIEFRSPTFQADSLPSEPPGKPFFISSTLHFSVFRSSFLSFAISLLIKKSFNNSYSPYFLAVISFNFCLLEKLLFHFYSIF